MAWTASCRIEGGAGAGATGETGEKASLTGVLNDLERTATCRERAVALTARFGANARDMVVVVEER